MLRRLFSLLTVVLAYAAVAGCAADSSSPPSDAANAADTASIQVPDLSGGDGAQAVSDVQGAGLEPTLADANDDPSFDTSRDATDCEVTDQQPAAGESASEGDEVIVTVDCAQVDWGNEEGPQWETFNDAYTAGFDDGCQALFDQSPNGSLYEDGTEYSAVDCQRENPGDASSASDVPSDVPEDPEGAGADLGQLDGCQALFENQGVYSLNYGSDSITEADCPVGGGAAPASSQPTSTTADGGGSSSSPSGGAETAGAGARCTGKAADGTPIVLKVTAGKVKCAGAVALVNEWLRRAPHEGQGSSGHMELYGWGCTGALATQPDRVGSCQRGGKDAAAFSMTVAPGK